EAFESMSGLSREELLAPDNREELVRLLRAHIVADDLDRDMAGNIPEAQTIDGGSVSVDVEDGEFTVGDASVVTSDIQRGNLRVHVVDGLLASPLRVAEAPAEPDTPPQREARPEQAAPAEQEATSAPAGSDAAPPEPERTSPGSAEPPAEVPPGGGAE